MKRMFNYIKNLFVRKRSQCGFSYDAILEIMDKYA